jgi:hypothetical protein
MCGDHHPGFAMSFDKHEAESIRIDMLRMLITTDADSRSVLRSCNEHLMARILTDRGYFLTQDQVRKHAAHLQKHGLIAIDQIGEVQVYRMLDAGVPVAMGRKRVAGVGMPELPTA